LDTRTVEVRVVREGCFVTITSVHFCDDVKAASKRFDEAVDVVGSLMDSEGDNTLIVTSDTEKVTGVAFYAC